MKFSSLFRVMGKDVEMEVYQDNPGRHMCTVTKASRVSREAWNSYVKTVTPVGLDRVIIVVERNNAYECKDQCEIHDRGGAGRSDPATVSGGEVLEGGQKAERSL